MFLSRDSDFSDCAVPAPQQSREPARSPPAASPNASREPSTSRGYPAGHPPLSTSYVVEPDYDDDEPEYEDRAPRQFTAHSEDVRIGTPSAQSAVSHGAPPASGGPPYGGGVQLGALLDTLPVLGTGAHGPSADVTSTVSSSSGEPRPPPGAHGDVMEAGSPGASEPPLGERTPPPPFDDGLSPFPATNTEVDIDDVEPTNKQVAEERTKQEERPPTTPTRQAPADPPAVIGPSGSPVMEANPLPTSPVRTNPLAGSETPTRVPARPPDGAPASEAREITVASASPLWSPQSGDALLSSPAPVQRPPAEAITRMGTLDSIGSEAHQVDPAALPTLTVAHPSTPAKVPEDEESSQSSLKTNRFGRVINDTVEAYARKLPTRRPVCCSCCGTLVVIAVAVLGMIVFPMEVETDFGSFMKTDVNSSAMNDGFKAALSARTEKRRRLAAATLFKSFDVILVYELKDQNENVLDEAVLRRIAEFERMLTSQSKWVEYCDSLDKDKKRYCRDGLSIVNYAMPQLDVKDGEIVPSKMTFNGKGQDRVPTEVTMRAIEKDDLERKLLPRDFDAKLKVSNVARSFFRFKFFCCTSADSSTHQRAVVRKLAERYDKFVDWVLPFLQEYAPGGSKAESKGEGDEEEGLTEGMRIYFTGSGFQQREVMATLKGDITLAGGSMVFVLLYLIAHTRSIFLGAAGLFLILLAVPFSYVLFAVLAGTSKMSIASFLSLFLVVGLGSDVIFVYSDFWRDSKRHHSDVAKRFMWTQTCAGKASLATSATTALSFFANLASVLRPLREFGTFMGLCVIIVWLLISLLFLPLCLVDDRYFARCRLASRRSEADDARSPGGSSAGIFSAVVNQWEYFVYRRRRTCLVSALLFGLLSLILASLFATIDTSGTPALFPEDHNQVRGKKVMSRFVPANEVFGPIYRLPPEDKEVCREWSFRNEDAMKCNLFWCEVDSNVKREENGACRCFRHEKTDPCDAEVTATTVTRYVGAGQISEADLSGPIADSISFKTSLRPNLAKTAVSEMSPIILEEWETGVAKIKKIYQVRSTSERIYSNASCGWKEVCFCGTSSCAVPRPPYSWLPQTRIVGASSTQRRLNELQFPVFNTIPSNLRADIAVVFGLDVATGKQWLGERPKEEVWSFHRGFQAQQPWAQRNLYFFCVNAPPALRVDERLCWIKDFRDWLGTRKKRFPVPRNHFNNLVSEFLQTGLTGLVSTKEFVWMHGGKVKACYLQFYVDFSQRAKVEHVMDYMEEWDKYVKDYNAQASRFARGAWHTSGLWVRAEAQKELISSTFLTLIIVIVLAFVGMLFFTFDPTLSAFVVVATLVVICGLAFFIVCVMQWPIGPIEVIALIVFIGYAVTYSLHITHKYGDHKALKAEPERPEQLEMDGRSSLRYQRTGFALKSIGAAALGSAITTCGCSAFLLGCTLTIFQKLGGVVLAVTMMSIITALAPLPAALLAFGPLEPGRKLLPWSTSIALREAPPRSPRSGSGTPTKEAPASPMSPENRGDAAQVMSPAHAMPGDGVHYATALAGQDVQAFRRANSIDSADSEIVPLSRDQHYPSSPVPAGVRIAPREVGFFGYASPTAAPAGSGASGAAPSFASAARRERSPAAVEGVHLDVNLDSEEEVIADENVLHPISVTKGISGRPRPRE